MTNTHDEKYALWLRNVKDEYKDLSTEEIKQELKSRSLPAAILMAQIEGDFNFGSIIRTANNFNLSKVYYYGKKRYDKRAACGTYKYTEVIFLSSIEEVEMLKLQYRFVGLENNIKRVISNLTDYSWQDNSLICVGEENAGIPQEILELCNDYVEIPSMGSVRSLNAAVAASIAMYDYVSKRKE